MSGSAADRVRAGAAPAIALALVAWCAGLGHADLTARPWNALATWGAAALGAAVVWLAWNGRPGRWAIVLGALVAVAARWLVSGTLHPLSDDIARYAWDGRVFAHGINPYQFAPTAPELEALRRMGPALALNHPDLHTVYPPLAQLAFTLAWRLDPQGFAGFRGLALAAETVTVLLLARVLVREGRPLARLALLAWLPLAVLEGHAPGHVDTLVMPFVVAALTSIESRRAGAAGFWLGLAALIKPFPLLIVPAALRELEPRGRARLLATIVLVVAVGYAPFAGAGHWLFDSMWRMAREWVFNGSLAALLAAWLGNGPARIVSLIAMIAAIVAAVSLGGTFRRRVVLAIVAFVAFTPTLYPWYLVWALPVLVLQPHLALLSVVVLVPLSYHVLIPWQELGLWRLPAWVPIVEYVPFYALLALGAWRPRDPVAGADAR